MSDELDKFVLQYTVEMKDAITRLEQLQNKIHNVNKESAGAKAHLKEFATGASDELGKVIPIAGQVSNVIRTMGTEFAVVTAAVGVLAVGIKSLMTTRDQYNKQRQEGMDIGVSSLRLEEYQRKFSKASGGYITREQTSEEIKKLSQFSSAIYRDPTRVGTEARTARVLGLDMGMPGQHMGVNAIMTQLGNKFSKMTEDQVKASAKTLGISQDFALGLKKQGGSVGKVTELTAEEIEKRKSAEKSLGEFNAQMEKLKESFIKATNIIGEKLLPPFTRFVNKMGELADKIPAEKIGKWTDNVVSAVGGAIDMAFGTSPTQAIVDRVKLDLPSKKTEADTSKAIESAVETGTKTVKTIDGLIDEMDDENASARSIADQNALAINTFAGAVASFANAVDEKQAWAAWAGEVGKASGLDGVDLQLGTLPVVTDQAANRLPSGAPVRRTQYDDLFNAAGAKENIDPLLLKNMARVESGFNPKAKSEAGAAGIMQIMPSNFKSLGITDPHDPKQNIFGGAKLLAEYIKAARGDIEEALRMYHGGYKKSGWGERTKAYPEKVLGKPIEQPIKPKSFPSMANTESGESRAKINLKSTQNTIAQRLGIPVQQLQLGGVNRGDVDWANKQLQAGVQNQIFDLKNQLRAVNLPQQTRSKLMNELRSQQTGLNLMRQYGSQVSDAAREGDRVITIGERAIIININGVDDPSKTADQIKSQLDEHLGEIVNGMSNGMKY